MMRRWTAASMLLGLAGCAPLSSAPPTPPAAARDQAPSTFVLIHGAWGGGWAWRAVDSLMTAAGHTVSRPTLTGLGERVHLAHAGIDLATHVTDVVNHLTFERLDDVVLVGHSYGGMVALGVAHRVPERIRRVVLVDAFLPEDGESAVDAVRGTRMQGWTGDLVGGAVDGLLVPSWTPPDAPRPSDVPHPVATFTQPASLGNAAADALPGTYILTADPGTDPDEDFFAPFAARALGRGWDVRLLEGDHNPQNSARAAITAMLIEAAAGGSRP